MEISIYQLSMITTLPRRATVDEHRRIFVCEERNPGFL
jgi:hypothetical protein